MKDETPTLADLKASLAAAYAAGDQPKFVSVVPDGFNELWSMAGIALVMPIVAPDAPDRLQFALRLRRETLMTGTCPHCSATVEVQDRDQFVGMAAGTAFFAHSARCPGEDSTVMRQVQSYLAERETKDEEAWFDSANKQARARLEPWKAQAGEIVSLEGRSRTEEILAAELDPDGGLRTCQHLGVTPAQTWICLIGEGLWRCEQCWEYSTVELATRMQRGDPGPLGWIDDVTCDMCDKIYPHGLRPLLLRINNFVMHGGVCRRCSELHAAPADLHTTSAEKGTLGSSSDLESTFDVTEERAQ